jgi:hypothetical protein
MESWVILHQQSFVVVLVFVVFIVAVIVVVVVVAAVVVEAVAEFSQLFLTSAGFFWCCIEVHFICLLFMYMVVCACTCSAWCVRCVYWHT